MNTLKGWKCGNGYMDDLKTIRTTRNLMYGDNWKDTHAWLEDDEGRVYDCITKESQATMKRHDPNGLRWKLNEGLIIGETKEDLKKKGYEVIPMPMESRELVLEILSDQGYTCRNTIELLEGVKL